MKGFRPQAELHVADRTSASARAYAALRRMILHGDLPSGTPISEVEMAAKLEVSRTPVHEALRELSSEGLVEEGPRRQAVVGAVSQATLREVSLMRDVLERLTAREAARRPDTSQLDQLRLIMIRARRAIRDGDITGFLDCDDDSHLQIARAAELSLVEEALRQIRGLTRVATIGTSWTDELCTPARGSTMRSSTPSRPATRRGRGGDRPPPVTGRRSARRRARPAGISSLTGPCPRRYAGPS